MSGMRFDIILADLVGFLFAVLNAQAALDCVRKGRVAIEGRAIARPIVLATRTDNPVLFWVWIVAFGAISAFLVAVATFLFVMMVTRA